jgi:rubrerythrin
MLYPPACYFSLHDCAQICTGVAANFKDCRVAEGFGCDSNGAFVAPDGGPIRIECAMCAGVGRRPSGLARASFEDATTALGDFFARVAHLEAASVDAFVALGDELAERGAPRGLVKLAARCARDERRHARVTSRLARRFGGAAPTPRVARPRFRSATAMAIENAVEGCVRETYGAMVAMWQAAHAGDAEIAKAMDRIAIDETRHAAMAWSVARWLDLRLDARGRARVAAAKRAAIAELRREVATPPDASVVREAGVPNQAHAKMLLDAIDDFVY